MAILVGSAAAPRWWDLDHANLEDYLARLRSWGATASELVLHHGPADDQIVRVHILEPDWRNVAERFHAAGLICHVHAPLAPRFSLRRWADEREALERDYAPILAEAERIAQRQGESCVVVIHGANRPVVAPEANATATVEFLQWAAERCDREFPSVRLALELRRADGAKPPPDASRSGIIELVERVGSARVGICWDVGHDWENREREPDWTPAPGDEFLLRVIHVHAHDAGPDGTVHYPLVTGQVPIAEQISSLLAAGYAGSITLEVRYRFAAALGDPLEMLEASFRRLRDCLSTEG